MRTFFMGDLHGCRKTFRKCLLNIGFSLQDILVLTMDVPDRGPDTKGLVDDIIKLESLGYDIRKAKANHEDLLLCADTEWVFNEWMKSGGAATLESYGIDVTYHLDRDFTIKYDFIPNVHSLLPKEHMDFFKSLTTTVEIDNFVCVHAGLNFHIKDPINKTTDFEKMWERIYQYDASRINNKVLVTGHTITDKTKIIESVEFVKKHGYGHIRVDNGCCMARGDNICDNNHGSLCCVEMNSLEVYFERCID